MTGPASLATSVGSSRTRNAHYESVQVGVSISASASPRRFARLGYCGCHENRNPWLSRIPRYSMLERRPCSYSTRMMRPMPPAFPPRPLITPSAALCSLPVTEGLGSTARNCTPQPDQQSYRMMNFPPVPAAGADKWNLNRWLSSGDPIVMPMESASTAAAACIVPVNVSQRSAYYAPPRLPRFVHPRLDEKPTSRQWLEYVSSETQAALIRCQLRRTAPCSHIIELRHDLANNQKRQCGCLMHCCLASLPGWRSTPGARRPWQSASTATK